MLLGIGKCMNTVGSEAAGDDYFLVEIRLYGIVEYVRRADAEPFLMVVRRLIQLAPQTVALRDDATDPDDLPVELMVASPDVCHAERGRCRLDCHAATKKQEWKQSLQSVLIHSR